MWAVSFLGPLSRGFPGSIAEAKVSISQETQCTVHRGQLGRILEVSVN